MSSVFFIAVQCYQCSTMQVKQRKKSSNKWNCVVCNEKQSLRKVFSQGFMAKGVRKFVQTFNMSRHFIEQQPAEETLPQQHVEIQPRTDWSEYVDVHINYSGIGDDKGEMCEPNVVTELLFKKPKLKSNYSAAAAAGLELHRPVFGKRNMKKKFDNPESGKGIVKGRVGDNQHNPDAVDHWSVMKPNSKWNGCDSGSSSVMIKLKRPVSKWNNYIDDDVDDESRCEEMNDAAVFETKVSDEIVEDDVHPHFM